MQPTATSLVRSQGTSPNQALLQGDRCENGLRQVRTPSVGRAIMTVHVAADVSSGM